MTVVPLFPPRVNLLLLSWFAVRNALPLFAFAMAVVVCDVNP